MMLDLHDSAADGSAATLGRRLLDYAELAAVIEASGIPLPAQRLLRTPDEAAAFAAGRRVVLKLISPDLVHKSDAGGVRLDLSDESAVRAAAAELASLAGSLGIAGTRWQILAQEMVGSAEVEIFVGIKRDRTFGPVVIVGAGGRLVELLPGRAIRRCPVSVDEAETMLAEITIGGLLAGYRGARDNLRAVAELVAQASRLPDHIAGLEELDFNPALVTDKGPLVVDFRAVVAGGSANARAPAAPAPGRDLRPLLEPGSIVVIGASATPGALMPGNRVLNYLKRHGYAGQVRVVHPSASEIAGFPAVPSVEHLAGAGIDLACVAVSANTCVDIIERCGKAGMRAAVVLSSGFSEVGNAELEAELRAVAEHAGILLCGPNTVGVMSPRQHVHVCFSQMQEVAHAIPGPVALVAQSGAVGGSLIGQAWQRGIGISRFISVGNQAMLNSTDFLDYLVDDPETRIIALLLEGVADGGALVSAAERLRDAGKSLVMLKVGRSEEGSRAVQSHTGSIAGDYAVYKSVLRQAGATMVDSITELLDLLELKNAGISIPRDARMAVLSTSGGACAMVADFCEEAGFRVPELSDGLRAELGTVLPPFAATANPIDVTGQVATDPALYGRALEIVLKSDEIDLVTVMLTTIADPQAGQIATEVVKQVKAQKKPVLVCWTIPPELARNGLSVFADASIPVFDDPARAIRAASLTRT